MLNSVGHQTYCHPGRFCAIQQVNDLKPIWYPSVGFQPASLLLLFFLSFFYLRWFLGTLCLLLFLLLQVLKFFCLLYPFLISGGPKGTAESGRTRHGAFLPQTRGRGLKNFQSLRTSYDSIQQEKAGKLC